MEKTTTKKKLGTPLKWPMINPTTGERWHQGEKINYKGKTYKFLQYSYREGNLYRPVFCEIEKWNNTLNQRRTHSRNANTVIRSNLATSSSGKFKTEVKQLSVMLGVAWKKHFPAYNTATVKLNCSLTEARTRLYSAAMMKYDLTQEQVIERIHIKDQSLKLTIDHVIPLCCSCLFFDEDQPWIAHYILLKLSDISNLQVLTLQDNKRKGHNIIINNTIVEVKESNKEIIKQFLKDQVIFPNV